MDEEKIRQIIRDEIRSELWQIRLHLLAISQATEAVPWKYRYLLDTDETDFPYRVQLRRRDTLKGSAISNDNPE